MAPCVVWEWIYPTPYVSNDNAKSEKLCPSKLKILCISVVVDWFEIGSAVWKVKIQQRVESAGTSSKPAPRIAIRDKCFDCKQLPHKLLYFARLNRSIEFRKEIQGKTWIKNE